MATKTLTVCDFDEHEPDEDVLADHQRTFPADGGLRTIDLCDSCLPKFEAFEQLTQRWVKCGRPFEPERPKRTRAPRPKAVETENAVVRAWAREHGWGLGDRGRIPDEVRAAYAEWQRSRSNGQPVP